MKQKFLKFTIFAMSVSASSAWAEWAPSTTLPGYFKSMSNYRGPMGKNIIQGTGGRSITPSFPPGKRLFQGGFRSNESGRPMAKLFDFYVGNLFSSNYYELMETFVFGIESNDSQSDTALYNPYRELNQAALIASGPKSMPRAASMLRHWILEKYYVKKFPTSVLALSFQRWGVGDSADEQRFASEFFNYYLSVMSSDLQFLPAYLLIRQSPVGDSNQSPSLERARNLVAEYPHDRESLLGRIRNAIHNQLSPIVIDMIDQFQRENGYLPEGLAEVRSILVKFFSFSPSKSAVIAKRLGLVEFEAIANILANDEKSRRTSTLQDMLLFSNEAAKLKSSIGTASIATANKADALLLLSYASQFLNSRMTNDKLYTSAELSTSVAGQIVLNAIYIEGLLIKRNWEYFSTKVNAAQDVNQLSEAIAQATKIGTDTLMKAMSPAFDQWKSIEPRMESFIDSTIKSSSLNTASILLWKIRK